MARVERGPEHGQDVAWRVGIVRCSKSESKLTEDEQKVLLAMFILGGGKANVELARDAIGRMITIFSLEELREFAKNAMR